MCHLGDFAQARLDVPVFHFAARHSSKSLPSFQLKAVKRCAVRHRLRVGMFSIMNLLGRSGRDPSDNPECGHNKRENSIQGVGGRMGVPVNCQKDIHTK